MGAKGCLARRMLNFITGARSRTPPQDSAAVSPVRGDGDGGREERERKGEGVLLRIGR